MGLDWHGKQVLRHVNRLTAEYLLDIGLLAQQTLMDRLNTPYPPASRPGEFPHRRTGRLRQSVGVEPNTVEGIMANRYALTLYYEPEGYYGDILTAKGRLGPADVMNEVKQKLQAGSVLGN